MTSDDKGMLSITWPQAGRYYLEASSSDDKVSNKKPISDGCSIWER